MGTRRLWIALLLAVLQYAGANPCTQCSTTVPAATCVASNNCEAGGQLESGSQTDSNCNTLKCPARQLLITEPATVEASDKLVCNDQSMWENEDGKVVTAAVCKKPISCKTSVPLDIACDSALIASHLCVPVDLIEDNFLSCSGAAHLFLKSGENPWEDANNIFCNLATGQWQRGVGMSLDQTLQANDKLICADRNPGATATVSCTSASPLQSVCPPSPVFCQAVMPPISDDVPITCPPGKILYSNKAAVGVWTAVMDAITCRKSDGRWLQGTAFKLPLDADNVVCADGDLNPRGACPVLTTTCETAWTANNGCDEPSLAGIVNCQLSSKKLYFKRAQEANFQEAASIDCDFKGKLKYNYGPTPKEMFLTVGDHVICATSNPNPAVCSFAKFEVPDNYEAVARSGQFEAGKVGSCKHPQKFDFINKGGDILRAGNTIVCNPDGSWSSQGGELFGAKNEVACAQPSCKRCSDTVIPANLPNSEPAPKVMHTGTCSRIQCSDQHYYNIKIPGDINEYYTSPIAPKCDGKLGAFVFWNGKEVEKVDCTQKLYCIELNLVQVKLDCPPEIAGCDKPTVTNAPLNAETLACTLPKKMFIRDDEKEEKYWEEIKTPSITCDTTMGKWAVDIVGADPGVQYRAYHHTIICADSNPQPKSTTTTTTTTPPPLRPICDVCRDALVDLDMFTCETCSSNDTKLEQEPVGTEPALGDMCLLNPAKGRELIINNFEEVKPPLICKREVGKWTTRADAPIYKFSARLLTKKDAWKALSYVVVGAVFVAIGGMGITCVVIFMKMRKQPSSREKKKKERGVTKKYTSSNVVKTDNKSRGMSKEGGKSKEGSASKMDSNIEDAPTLKL